jgi:putative transposase
VKYTIKKKIWCVKQIEINGTNISELSRNRRIPRMTLYRWYYLFKKYGTDGLLNKPCGAKKLILNENCEKIIIETWNNLKFGAPKMHLYLKSNGFGISERQIQKVYNKYDIKMNRRKRPSQLKFVKYEWPKPNMLWHTDWTSCPFTGKQLIAFIDDYSRYIVHAEYFENATTENTILAFANAINRFGKPEAILTDNGTQFTPARSEKGPFTIFCENNCIKHILGRVHHPQTNGKIERWFGTYKLEYDERFECLNDFVRFYNDDRIHQGINYKKPKERYFESCNINVI